MGRHDDRPAVVRTARPSVTPVAWCALVGVAARVLVAMAAADAGLFADMAQYDERARHLAATGTLWPDALRGPGYPALLAFAYTVFGPSLWTARVANALVGGALVVATGVLARAAGAGRHAWVASAIVAVYPALVLSSVYVMPEGLYALLIVATLVAVRHRTPAFAVAAGLAMGAAMLTRSVGVALAAAPLTLWLRAGRRGEASWRTALARLAMLAGACALVLAPWLAFTTRVAGGPLLDATSGVNLLLGNHPRATGRLVLGDEAELRGTYVAGAASTADGNARAIRAAVSWAFAHPGPWTQLAIAKLGYLFGLEGREHAWSVRPRLLRRAAVDDGDRVGGPAGRVVSVVVPGRSRRRGARASTSHAGAHRHRRRGGRHGRTARHELRREPIPSAARAPPCRGGQPRPRRASASGATRRPDRRRRADAHRACDRMGATVAGTARPTGASARAEWLVERPGLLRTPAY